MIPTAPCKDCKDRELGCHGKCEKYLAYKEAKSEFNKQMTATRSVENYYKISCAESRRLREKKKYWRKKVGN